MPGQEIAQPNPPADPSQLSDAILEYSVQLKTKDYLVKDELKSVQFFRRAADYIAAGELTLCKLAS
jgi:xylulose-5-phosphate/fructose-6-phosphate phosphoketolase